ncbi:LysR substrate-binding domain-containing protein [Pseudomonas aeruginosa]|uniref:LysR family transcriptional regulator n=1 Tax=Pseudomonas aeruginosa TaxID=287 RepID=UPI0039837A8F
MIPVDHLTALKVFRAVAANGGFAAAARQMNLSPAAVSKNVAELEAHLKVRLINRTTRSMSLTEAGEVYRQRLERILDDLEAADAALTSMQQGPSGLLRVSAPLTLALTCLTPAIPAFLQRYPELRLELLLQDGRQDLIAEGIDLALRGSDRVADSGLVARPLLVLEHVLCAAPAYLSQHGQPLRPETLREHECIRFSLSGHADRWTFRKDRECIAVPIAGRYRVSSSLAVRDALLAGFGLSLIPRLYVQAELAEGRLVELLADWKADETAIHAVYPSRQLAGKTRVFLDFLTETMAQGHDSPTL